MPAPPYPDYILDGQQAIAGLLGSIIMVLKDHKKRTRAEQIAQVLGGTASAVYLTEPLIGLFWSDPQPKHLLGFSFLFGVAGLKIIEICCEWVEKNLKNKLGQNE